MADNTIASEVTVVQANMKKLFAQPPLLPVDQNTPRSLTDWLMAKTYTNFAKEQLNDSVANMYNEMQSNSKLANMMKVVALNAIETNFSLILVDAMKNFSPDTTNTVGYFSSSKNHLVTSKCDWSGMYNCKTILAHELGHAAIKLIFKSYTNPYYCYHPTYCRQAEVDKFHNATFATIKNLLSQSEATLSIEQKQQADGITDYSLLGKFAYNICNKNRYTLCVIADGFSSNYNDNDHDSETIANYVETFAMNLSEGAASLLEPLDKYWEENVVPMLQRYIDIHPSNYLII